MTITLNVHGHVLAHALGARGGLTPDPVHPSFAACTSREDTHAHRLCSLYLLRRQVISGACKWQERQRETDRDWDRERQVREEREGANGEDEERCVQRQRGGVTAVGDDGQETLIMATSTLLLTKEQPSPRPIPRTAFLNPATLRSAPSASLLSILEPPSPTPLHWS